MTDIVLKNIENNDLSLNLLYSVVATIAPPRQCPSLLDFKDKTYTSYSGSYHEGSRSEYQSAIEEVVYNKVVKYLVKSLANTSDKNFDIFQNLLQSLRACILEEKIKREKERAQNEEEKDDKDESF